MARRDLTVSFDLAKAGLLPLVIGFVSSATYYSQFRVPTLSILAPQAVVCGLYVLLAYGVLPRTVYWLMMRRVPRFAHATTALTLLLIAVSGLYSLGAGPAATATHAVSTVVLQLALLWSFGWQPKHPSVQEESIDYPVPLASVVAIAACSVHFGLVAYPHIPYYYAGGRPVSVTAVPNHENRHILGDVFSDRTTTMVPELTAFRMTLLYETSDDYYFLTERRGTLAIDGSVTSSLSFGSVVTRVQREAILRLDYTAPATIALSKEMFR